jgi:glycosyltransferase involved in cell wall biosynthesis
MTGDGPRVTVVVPVYNSRGTIGKCLDSLTALDHPSFEIIVLDDGSTDGTPETCESYTRVKTVRLKRGGPSRARNLGIDLAAGEFVAFTDGDCVVDRNWLQELEKGFLSPEVGGVGGDQKSPDDESMTGKRIQEFMKCIGFVTGYIKTDRSLRETEHNPSCCSMYRRKVLQEVGGFEEGLFPSEDVDLDLKIKKRGYKLIYNPAASVAHYRPGTYSGFAGMMRRYGQSQWPLVRKYGMFRTIHAVPAALALGLVAVLAVLMYQPLLLLFLGIPLVGIPVWFLGKTGSVGKALLFTYLFMLTVSHWNWGFFRGMISGR